MTTIEISFTYCPFFIINIIWFHLNIQPLRGFNELLLLLILPIFTIVNPFLYTIGTEAFIVMLKVVFCKVMSQTVFLHSSTPLRDSLVSTSTSSPPIVDTDHTVDGVVSPLVTKT